MILTTLVVMVGACSSVPADHLTGAAPPTPDRGDVYLYRSTAAKAADRSFSVYVDEQPVGELADGSFLWLRLHPGGHQLKVVPGRSARSAELSIKVEGGAVSYFQYDFPTGVMANPFFIGAAIRERSIDDAVEVLPGLKVARGLGNPPAVGAPIDAGSAVAVDDVDAVPRLNDRGRASYREWLRMAPPRAFVVAADGTAHWSWGGRTIVDKESLSAADRAIRQCQVSGRDDCRLYAVDHRVVWEASH